MNLRRFVLLVVLLLAWVGCGDGRAPGLDADAPGFGDTKSIACTSESDCREGETCGEGVCQMKRCTNTTSYASAAPFGARGYLARSRQIVSAAGKRGASHVPHDHAFDAGKSFALGGDVIDVAGGNFRGQRAESAAFAVSGRSEVLIDGSDPVAVGFVPSMLAAGDLDGDGVDEVVAADASGRVVACDETCVDLSPGRSGLVDVTTGDVDGDGRAEVLLLSAEKISVLKAGKKGREGDVADYAAPARLYRLAAGELANPDQDEVIALQHGAYLWEADKLVRLELGNGQAQARSTLDLAGSAKDVVIDALGSREGHPVVLVDGSSVDVFDAGDEFRLSYRAPLGTSGATRLASADLDGQSAILTLKSKEAELVASDAAPVSAVFAPPYSQQFSGGVSLAGVGATKSDSNSSSKSVAVNYGLSVGFGVGFELPIRAVNVGGSVNLSFHAGWGSSRSTTKGTSTSVGSSFWLSVDPEADDYKSGAVLLACGCFHRYDYEVSDPTGLVPSADKKGVRVLVPVGGQTAIWSVRRYNALASQLKDKLPKIQVPYTDGAIDSYPDRPTTFDGKPVPQEDLVFPKAPWLRASDAADVWFNLDASEHESTSTARNVSTSYGVTASGSIGPVSGSVGADRGYSWDFSEEIGVSDATSFLGMIPALKNNMETPEDEYAANAYSFQPVVYVHRYALPNGRKSGFYVLTYAVKK